MRAIWGALVGRCANRIRGARFQLGGRPHALAANQPPNHLHGGNRGFDQYLWDHRIEGDSLVLTRLSPAGEEGYPGALQTQVRYTFGPDNALLLELQAVSDADTVVNLTSHAYWNLNGHGAGDVGGHTLSIDASPSQSSGRTTAPRAPWCRWWAPPLTFAPPGPWPTAGTPTTPRSARAGAMTTTGPCGARASGRPPSSTPRRAASPWPSPPLSRGLQVYTANFLPESTGKGGAVYGRRRGVALEAQGFPNAVNQPEFPSTVLKAGETYHQEILFAFTHD